MPRAETQRSFFLRSSIACWTQWGNDRKHSCANQQLWYNR